MFKSTLPRSLFLLDPLFSLFLLFGVFVRMARHVIADLFKPVLFKLVSVYRPDHHPVRSAPADLHHHHDRNSNGDSIGQGKPLLAPYWIIAPRSCCIAAPLGEQFYMAPWA